MFDNPTVRKIICSGCGNYLTAPLRDKVRYEDCPKCGTELEILPLTLATKILGNVIYIIAFSAAAGFITWLIALGKPNAKREQIERDEQMGKQFEKIREQSLRDISRAKPFSFDQIEVPKESVLPKSIPPKYGINPEIRKPAIPKAEPLK